MQFIINFKTVSTVSVLFHTYRIQIIKNQIFKSKKTLLFMPSILRKQGENPPSF